MAFGDPLIPNQLTARKSHTSGLTGGAHGNHLGQVLDPHLLEQPGKPRGGPDARVSPSHIERCREDMASQRDAKGQAVSVCQSKQVSAVSLGEGGLGLGCDRGKPLKLPMFLEDQT